MPIKRFFYFQDILMELIIKGGERMRKQLIAAVVFILCTIGAQGANGGGQASLDIVGSNVANTTFISPDGVPVVLEIVGSTASNIQVGALAKERPLQCRNCYECGACGELKIYTTPWDDFRRPLCYPWSSYIPTRYNRPMINRNWGGMAQGAVSLGQGMSTTG